MSKRFIIAQEEVDEAWKAVRQAAGGPGIDGKTIAKIAEKQEGELYKIWNRLSSGSYQAQAVQIISIPKAKGGERKLGIPTVTDRIAQTIVKNRLVKEVDHLFHEDSYAYRTGRSAIEAVLKTRERCISNPDGWVLEVDIKGFFDQLDHTIMLAILKRYTQDALVHLYAKKFMKAEQVQEDGMKEVKERGTPQGGVISPILSNLYLHEAFDKWMQDHNPHISFVRYSDDIVVHCVSEKQAIYIRDKIRNRLKAYNLELNEEKSRIVYAGKSNKHDQRGHQLSRKFTFLGYDFKPRAYKGKIVFTPGLGQGALLLIRKKIQELRIGSMCQLPMEVVARKVNKISRGWINYYGHSRRSELYKMAMLLDKRIVKYIKQKMKKPSLGQAWLELKNIKGKCKTLFAHWYMIGVNPQRAG